MKKETMMDAARRLTQSWKNEQGNIKCECLFWQLRGNVLWALWRINHYDRELSQQCVVCRAELTETPDGWKDTWERWGDCISDDIKTDAARMLETAIDVDERCAASA